MSERLRGRVMLCRLSLSTEPLAGTSMALKIGQLNLGKVDGKHEYLTPVADRDKHVFDAFLVPEMVEPSRMHNGDILFVEGFRGTGKTSLLRWHAEQRRKAGDVTDFVLFKSDLTEAQRLSISSEVGISWTDVDPTKMEISQDFKSAWGWFILHKIAEVIEGNSDILNESSSKDVSTTLRLFAIRNSETIQKVLGFLPKLSGSKIKVRADVGFFSAELGGDLTTNGDTGETTLDAIIRRATKLVSGFSMRRGIYLYFDELEVFNHTEEQHKRDQRMVRDLLFAIDRANGAFRKASVPINVVAAVRSEVVDAMGSLGQEVDRLVHDRGFSISWHHAKRSLDHPLLKIIGKKIQVSEKIAGLQPVIDPIQAYFPDKLHGRPVDAICWTNHSTSLATSFGV